MKIVYFGGFAAKIDKEISTSLLPMETSGKHRGKAFKVNFLFQPKRVIYSSKIRRAKILSL